MVEQAGTSQQSDVVAADQPVRDGPVGLGGWLVLPLLGMMLAPLFFVVLIRDYLPLFSMWEYLSPVQNGFVITELLVNVLTMVVAPLVLLVFAFRKLEIFPGLYMIWLGLFPVILVLDAVVGFAVFRDLFEASGEPMFDSATKKSIGQTLFQAAIWIPYMMRSQRVENTFVN